MNIQNFIFAMQCGDEIEFSLNGQKYFLQPDYATLNENRDKSTPIYSCFVLYDSNNYDDPTELYRGTVEEIMNYTFLEAYTLKGNFKQFKIDYIL